MHAVFKEFIVVPFFDITNIFFRHMYTFETWHMHTETYHLHIHALTLIKLPVSWVILCEPPESCGFLNCWDWLKFTTQPFRKLYSQTAKCWQTVVLGGIHWLSRQREGCVTPLLMMKYVLKVSELEQRTKLQLHKKTYVLNHKAPSAPILQFSIWHQRIPSTFPSFTSCFLWFYSLSCVGHCTLHCLSCLSYTPLLFSYLFLSLTSPYTPKIGILCSDK